MPEPGAIDIKSRDIQPPSKAKGEYRPLMAGQTVCTVKDEKGQNCAGHVKQWFTAPKEILSKAAPGNTIHRCQRCHAIYEGPTQEYLHPKEKTK
jgi:hypothetical protein